MNELLDQFKILKDKVFRRYIYAYLVTQINMWMMPVLTPILLSNRLGIGQEFAFSLGLQWLPSILMGPATGFLIKKWGPHWIYVSMMFLYAIVIFLLPLATTTFQLQIIILGLGIGQAVASPSSITLRAYVIPEGEEIAGNSIVISVQRFSKIIGPLLAGILVALFSVALSFVICATLCIPSIIALFAIPIKVTKANTSTVQNRMQNLKSMLKLIYTLLFSNRIILGLFVTAIGYTITLGALRIYLFSLAGILGNEERVYSLFIAAQGLGALAGAILSQMIISKMQRRLSLTAIYALVSIGEGVLLSFMNLHQGIIFVIFILIAASIVESLAYVTYFSLLQKLISKENQGLYNSLTLPIIDSSYLIGIVFMGLVINHLSLHVTLYIIVSFTIGTVLMFLKTFMVTGKTDLA